MKKTIKEYLYEDFESFMKSISYGGDLYDTFCSGFIFRGESSDKYKLIPSALREKNKELLWELGNFAGSDCMLRQMINEYNILRRFYYTCDNENLYVPPCNIRKEPILDINNPFTYDIWLPEDLYEAAGLAQHYGIPTRLLDWSQDIFVSLYFACIGAMKSIKKNDFNFTDNNIVLWALDAYEIEIDKIMNKIAPIVFIRPSYHGNPNLGAQKGLFTLWEFATRHGKQTSFTPTPLDIFLENNSKSEKTLLYKLKFPSKFTPYLYKELNKLGYHAARIFPGYQGVYQKISEDLLCEKIFQKINEIE